MHIKQEIRTIGIDDSSFNRSSDRVMIIGAVFRGKDWLEGVLRTDITRDGTDATDAITCMVRNSKFHPQLKAILLDGVTYAGFNPVDIKKLFEETGIPVIAVTRSMPDFGNIKRALENLPDPDMRWEIVRRAGNIVRVVTGEQDHHVYIQFAGLNDDDACEIVRFTSTRSSIPEPLRVAHLIAAGVVSGIWYKI